MNIEFSKEEYKVLLDVIYAGNLLINGMVEKEQRLKEHFNLEQKMYKLLMAEGLDDLVEYNTEINEYMVNEKYENSDITTRIDLYEDRVFFEELIVRLARRDALNKLGDENPNMTQNELDKLQLDLEDFYEEEVFFLLKDQH